MPLNLVEKVLYKWNIIIIIKCTSMMKDLTCADMLHIHAVHQPSAGVYVVDAAFIGLSYYNHIVF